MGWRLTLNNKGDVYMSKHIKYTKRKEIAFTDDEWQNIHQKSKEQGISASEYIRTMIAQGEIVTYKFDELIPFFTSLEEINKHLGKLTIVAQKSKQLDIESIDEIKVDIRQMRHDMISFLSLINSKKHDERVISD